MIKNSINYFYIILIMATLNGCDGFNERKNINIDKIKAMNINHHYIDFVAKKIFSDEYNIQDFLDVSCTPDFNTNTWICYISKYIESFDNNKYISNRANSSGWVVEIDFINEQFEIKEINYN